MNDKMKKKISTLLLTTFLGTMQGSMEVMAQPLSENQIQHFCFTTSDYLFIYQNEESKKVLLLENRMEQRKHPVSFQNIQLGSSIEMEKLTEFLATEAFTYCLKYSEVYGIDPWLLIALAYQESHLCHDAYIPSGACYNGYGVGFTQQESPNDSKFVSAYNYQTQEEDTVMVNMENACDLETNIQICAMKLQRYLLDRNHNVFLALQTYNYGTPMVNRALMEYALESGKTLEQITNDKDDFGWLTYIHDIHNFPEKYGLPGDTYGDDFYIEHVLRYYLGNYMYCRSLEKEEVFDFSTFETKQVYLFELQPVKESMCENEKIKIYKNGIF